MIPRTFPSTFAANGQQQMVVYSLPSITGLTAWIDYIPVKGVTTESATLENTYANGGYQVVDSLASLTGKQAWLDYIPVYEDASYTKPWSTDAGGYIPTSALAALLLDFTSGRLDPRITFSRTTNATLTNSAGLVANAPMNLLTFSEQFDNAAWSKINSASITANQTIAPNGTQTADLFSCGASASRIQQAVTTVSSTVYTISVYAKSGTANYVCLSSITASAGAIFNLLTGSVAATAGSSTQSITSVGNGWYRCSITYTATGTTEQAIFGASATATFTFGFYPNGDTGNTCSLWGAQLELGSTATTYNPTTVKNLLGFTENFDNAAWTKSNAFVQTNLVRFSEAFDDAAWTKQAAGVAFTPNAAVSPIGSSTADLATEDLLNSAKSVYESMSSAAGSYTGSVYVKANTGTRFVRLVISSASSDFGYVTVNMSTGAVTQAAASAGTATNTSASVSDAGSGWYRITLTTTLAASVNFFFLIPLDSGTAPTSLTDYGRIGYQGTGASWYFWGAQLVQGTSAGDYKATYAAAAAVGYTDIYGQPFAQKLVASADNSQHAIFTSYTTTAAPYTFSIYAKAAEQSWLFMRLSDSGGTARLAWFNLATGVVGTVGTNLTAAITSIGNGFYRCAITVSTAVAGAQNVLFGVSNADGVNSYTGDGTSGIYIFGAQLSDSASIDPYVYQPVAAPSSVAYYGPRFDYDPVTLAPKGLLIEEQRTNLLVYSEQLDNANWAKSALTVTANNATSPSGAVDADTLVSSGDAFINQFASGAASTTYTGSVWLRVTAGTRSVRLFRNDSGTGFSTTNVTVTTTWQRFSLTATSSGTATFIGFQVGGGGSIPNGATLEIWGAQLEAGAFATSYIPTVASQVTRAADSASMIGNNFARWYTQGPGTLYADSTQALTTANTFALFSAGVNIIRLGSGKMDVFVAGTPSAQIAGTVTGGSIKQAGAYQVNDFAISTNGGAVSTDTSGAVPFVDSATFSSAVGNSTNGTIKRIAYYNRRLSNTELQGITS